MPDPMDYEQEALQAFRENAVEQARRVVPALPGEAVCRRCSGANDRAEAGYAVCTDCVEQLQKARRA